MAVTVNTNYGTPTNDSITLASLASDTSVIAGRAGAAVTHAGEVDSLVGGKITLGTGPTNARRIEIWAYGSYDGVSFTGGATGADANLTPQEKSLMRLLTVIPTINTTNQTYNWGPFSIAQAFGGVLPKKTGIFIVHNTGVALKATAGDHEVKRTPIAFQSA